MTNAEKRALTEAFGIPEPQKKRQFIAEYQQLTKDHKKRLVPPLFIKIASTAAVCALVCGIWLNVRNKDIKPDLSANESISVVESIDENHDDTSEKETEPADNAVAVTSVKSISSSAAAKTTDKTTAKTTASSGTKTTVTTSKTQNNAVASDNKNNKNDNNEHRSDGTTAKQDKPGTTTSTSAKQDKHGTTTSTSAKKDKPVTTTTLAANQQQTRPSTTKNEEPMRPDDPVSDNQGSNAAPSGSDKRITPSVTYNDYNTIPAEALDPESRPVAGGADNSSQQGVKPVDQAPSTGGNGGGGGVDSTIRGLVYNSDHIIRCTVEDIKYTSENGKAYTQVDVYINEVISSNNYSLVEGDRISVRFMGGYISARLYAQQRQWETDVPEDWVVYESSNNYFRPAKGYEYIMFINDGGYEIPDGGYSFTDSTNISVLELQGGDYVTLDEQHYTSIYDIKYMT